MLVFHGCRRCGGALYRERDCDAQGVAWYCLACGNVEYEDTTSVLAESARRALAGAAVHAA